MQRNESDKVCENQYLFKTSQKVHSTRTIFDEYLHKVNSRMSPALPIARPVPLRPTQAESVYVSFPAPADKLTVGDCRKDFENKRISGGMMNVHEAVRRIHKEPSNCLHPADDNNLSQFLKQFRKEMTRVGSNPAECDRNDGTNQCTRSFLSDSLSNERTIFLSTIHNDEQLLRATSNEEYDDNHNPVEENLQERQKKDEKVLLAKEECPSTISSARKSGGRTTPGFKPNNWGVFSP